MKLSHQSINEYTSGRLNASPQEVRGFLNQMGAEVDSVEHIEDDVIFDIETTSNRPDWLGVVGLVRELTSATRDDITVVLKAVQGMYEHLPVESVEMALARQEQCPRYFARRFANVAVGDSPEWLKSYLTKNGMRSINNVVDILNFVMHETGHPLHAFDAERISGKPKVRNARAGEELYCLDEERRNVPEGAIVVSDDADALLAVAGVIGGSESQVATGTTSIIVESAYYDPVSVRRAAKGMRLSTEASFRFERGADPAMPAYALDRASDLLATYCNGQAIGDYAFDVMKETPRILTLRVAKVEAILGMKVEKEFMVHALKKLGFVVEDLGDTLRMKVPSWRLHDVKYEDCFIEEIGKVIGFDSIPAVMPKIEMNANRQSGELDFKDTVEQSLVGRGFNQMLNFAFMSPQQLEKFSLSEASALSHYPRIRNPLTVETSIMRPSLVPGLLGNYSHNFDHGERSIKIFEVGHIFRQAAQEEMPEERRTVAGLLSGTVQSSSWADKSRTANFYDIKSIVYSLLSDVGIDTDGIAVGPSTSEFFREGIGASISIDGVALGNFGCLKEGLVKPHKQRSPMFVFELDLDKLMRFADTAPRKIIEISKFPSIQRDIAVVCPTGFPSATIESEIRGAGKDLVRTIRLFDVYEGTNIESGHVSLAFNIEFNAPDRSLTNDEVGQIMQTIIQSLKEKHGIEIRK